MLGVLLAAVVIGWIGYLVFKEYKPQTVIFLGGMILLASAVLMGKPIIDAKGSLGLAWFDIFKVIENLFSQRAAGLGLMIMSCMGFARYMDHIGASKAFVKLGVKPLQSIHSPYLVLAIGYIIGQLIKMAITSAAGLGVLLMATMYPLLVGMGASREGAAAVIVAVTSIDLGPASNTSNLIAKQAGIDVVEYFFHYQVLVALPVILGVAVLHYFVQQYFDKKSGHVAVRSEVAGAQTEEETLPPAIYAMLPMLPLILIFTFNKVMGSKISMSLISAMLMGIFVSMLFEYIRFRDYKKVAKSIQSFFDGMGTAFATVVTLIIAAETLASGLKSIGAIDTIIKGAQATGFGDHAMILVMQAIVGGAALVTGSGEAAMFSFAALAPAMAKTMGIDPVKLLLPMQFTATLARGISPVSAVCVAVAGIAMISPIDVVKRTAIPLTAALIATTVINFVLF
jgi:DcuC family C4-dicarboxylate transporter